MDTTSRRRFLKLAALAAPSAASLGSLAEWAEGQTARASTGGPTQAWRSGAKLRC